MQMEALLASLAVMGAIICAAMAVFGLAASPRGSLERRLGGIIGDQSGASASQMQMGVDALRTRKTSLPALTAYLDRKNMTARIQAELERGDMRFSVSEFVALRVFLGLIGFVLGVILIGGGALGLLVAVAFGFVGYKLPVLQLHRKQGARLKKLNEQLLNALTMLSNSMKAGFGLMQGMDVCARDLAHPISTEFRHTIHDINVGATVEDALNSMAARCGSPDLDIIVTAMVIQQATGGNLSEILDNVNETMRERVRIRGEIKTLTTQQTMSGFVIGGLPPVLCAFIYVINPGYITPLYKDIFGIGLLVGAAILEFVGIMIIKKILAIEV